MNTHRIRLVVAALVIALPVIFATPAAARTFVVPQIIDDQSSTFTFDTWFHFVFTGGQAGIPTVSNSNTVVSLFLFDDTGAALQGQTGVICSPCQFALSSSNRQARKSVQQLANQMAGGLLGVGSRRLTLGFAVIVVTGANADTVALEAFIVNTHANGFDVSFMELPLREMPGP
jgi:hypothetical protein